MTNDKTTDTDKNTKDTTKTEDFKLGVDAAKKDAAAEKEPDKS